MKEKVELLCSEIKESIAKAKTVNELNNLKVEYMGKKGIITELQSGIKDATDKKAKTETSISKLSKIYTPTVLVLAILVAVFLPIFSKVTYSESIYRALTFLVIACPCAIAISIPLSYPLCAVSRH